MDSDYIKTVTKNGYCLRKAYVDKCMERVLNFEVYDSDIWVTGFPKSGTTWTENMAWAIANDFDYENSGKSMFDCFLFLEIASIHDFNDRIDDLSKMKPPRFIKTHLPWSLLPTQIQTFQKRPKIIHVVRDPKDIIVSLYNQKKLSNRDFWSFEELSRKFLENEEPYTPYWNNVNSYFEHRNESNVLILRYKDMKDDLPGIIRTVAKFLGKPHTEKQIQALSQYLQFEKMKQRNKPYEEEFKKKFDSKGNMSFMRSGKVGDYNNVMSKEMIQQFDDWKRTNVGNMGELDKFV